MCCRQQSEGGTIVRCWQELWRVVPLCVGAPPFQSASSYVLASPKQSPRPNYGIIVAGDTSTMQRIVLRHTYGPLAGLDQILGVWPDKPVPHILQDLGGQAILMKTEPRYILYQSAPQSEGQGAHLGGTAS